MDLRMNDIVEVVDQHSVHRGRRMRVSFITVAHIHVMLDGRPAKFREFQLRKVEDEQRQKAEG